MTDETYNEIVNRTINKAADEYRGSTETSATHRLLSIVLKLEARIVALDAQLVKARAETAALIDAVNRGSHV